MNPVTTSTANPYPVQSGTYLAYIKKTQRTALATDRLSDKISSLIPPGLDSKIIAKVIQMEGSSGGNLELARKNFSLANYTLQNLEKKGSADGLYEAKVSQICALIEKGLELKTELMILDLDGYDGAFLKFLLEKLEFKTGKPEIELIELETKNDAIESFLKISTAGGKSSFSKLYLKDFIYRDYFQSLKLNAAPFTRKTVSRLYEASGNLHSALIKQFASLKVEDRFQAVFQSADSFENLMSVLFCLKTNLLKDYCLTGNDNFKALMKALNFLTQSIDAKGFFKSLSKYDSGFQRFILTICGLDNISAKTPDLAFAENLLPTKGSYWAVSCSEEEVNKIALIQSQLPERISRHVGETAIHVGEIRINDTIFECQLPKKGPEANLQVFFKEILSAMCEAGWNKSITADEILAEASLFAQLALDPKEKAFEEIQETKTPLTHVLRFTSIHAFSVPALWIRKAYPEFFKSEFDLVWGNGENEIKGIEIEISITDSSNYTVKMKRTAHICHENAASGENEMVGEHYASLNIILQANVIQDELVLEKRIGGFDWITKEVDIRARITQILASDRQSYTMKWEKN